MDSRPPWLEDAPASDGRTVCEAFAAWFGSSRIVSANGKPLVVYRGDREKVHRFDREGRREPGQFFALEPERARCYGTARPYALRAERVLDLRDVYAVWADPLVREIVRTVHEDHCQDICHPETGLFCTLDEVIEAINEGFLWRLDGVGGARMYGWRALQELVEYHGFDCLIVHDDGEGHGRGVDYIVFEPEQVWSIEDNVPPGSECRPVEEQHENHRERCAA